MFQDAAALTFLLIVPTPKIFQSVSRSFDGSLLVTLTRSAEQQHDCPVNICEVNTKPDSARKSHFIQTASKRRTVAQVVVLLNGTQSPPNRSLSPPVQTLEPIDKWLLSGPRLVDQ